MRAGAFGLGAIAILVPMLVSACGGGGSPAEPPPQQSGGVASVAVTPAADTAASIDETVDFKAIAKDASGNTIGNVAFSWSSTVPAVASVSTTGLATAKVNGTTRIVASAAGKADTAVLVVKQKTASVAVSPDSATLSQVGDTVRFTATAFDANSHEVEGAEFLWAVSDTTFATVDGSGLVTARQAGRVEVTATAAGRTGTAALSVESSASPQIQSVSPSPLQEGQSATITGENFKASPAENTVFVDGVQATVTSASATTLQIKVPQYDCLPARDAVVVVQTASGAAESLTAVTPADAAVSLAVGEHTLITDPANFCLQFPETATSERYVVGVQSVSDVASALTPVTITAEAADGGGAALVAPLSLAVKPSLHRAGQEIVLPAWLEGQRRAEARLRQWERTRLDPGASTLARRGQRVSPPAFASVSGSAAVGDTVELRVPDVEASDICASFIPVTATVQAIGTRAIIVADTSNPANGFTQADYQDFSDQLDAQIFATDVAYFGDPGDIDGNGRIVILFTKEVNVFGQLLGFVFGGDLFPRSVCASSDEGELYYGRAPDPTGIHGTPVSRTEELRSAPNTMAHELVHLIQFGRRFATGTGFMESRLAEAQATLGEEVVGHVVTGRAPYQNYGFDVAFNTSSADEVDWYVAGWSDVLLYFGFKNSTERVTGAPEACGWWLEDPSPCLGRPLWYGVGWSFLRWVSDLYGPSYPGGEQGIQQDIVAGPATGPEVVADVVGVPLDSLLARWSAALYVDDRIGSADPALTFTSWNLFDFEQNTVSTAHLEPLEVPFADWTAAGDIRSSSAGYLALDGVGRPASAVRVRGAGESTLPSFMQVWIVRMR